MEGYAPGAVWDADDEAAAQIREVYARYGLAMFQAQVLEHSMVNALLVLAFLPTKGTFEDRTTWETAFDRFYDVELGRTFGNILRRLETVDGFPPSLLESLRSAKTHRDHLAHRFFREHDLAFMTANGRAKMIVECEERIQLFQQLDHDVEAFAAPARESNGITAEWLDEHMRLMEAEAVERFS